MLLGSEYWVGWVRPILAEGNIVPVIGFSVSKEGYKYSMCMYES